MPVTIHSDLILQPVRFIHTEYKRKPGYLLLSDFCVEWNDKLVTVPAGFGYNGASIPKALFQIMGTPFNPRYMEASCVHDWLYYTHLLKRRTEADRLFRSMLLESGVNKTIANNLFQAVYVFGGMFWKNRNNDLHYIQWLRDSLQVSGKKPADYGL